MAEGFVLKDTRGFSHLVAGGFAGTLAVIVTCPLEVVKTRLQASTSTSFMKVSFGEPVVVNSSTASSCLTYHGGHSTFRGFTHRPPNGFYRVYQLILHIVKTEGTVGLFRGIGPTIIGVAPHKAIYFHMYNKSKEFLTPYFDIDSPSNHLLSSGSASFVAATFTNPIWFVKTRLQLESNQGKHATLKLIRHVYKSQGIPGFYRGVTASYYGVSETMLYFVLYERLRLKVGEWRGLSLDENRRWFDYFVFMTCSALCKSAACCLAYPHEVARTRMREEGGRYGSFWQTLRLVFVEEGANGLYRGLFTALIRQIPNAAISMATYETVSHYLRLRGSMSLIDDEDDDGSVPMDQLMARS